MFLQAAANPLSYVQSWQLGHNMYTVKHPATKFTENKNAQTYKISVIKYR